jgi:hypothetical protein
VIRRPLFGGARAGALAPAAMALLFSQSALGEDWAPSRDALAARSYDRPYTLAQLGVGFLILPSADVCLKGRPCSKGDMSVQLDFWQLYRANRSFAIGAGASLALKPTTDNPPSAAGIDRSHTRSYFLVEAVGRYYWLSPGWMESWLGLTVGGVVVSDRYSVDGGETSNVSLIGPGSSTVRTEGGAFGAQLGAQWTISANWAAGASVRYARWFLPSQPATNVFQDRATLTDQQGMLDVGVHCSYRIPL